jgi:hypothetical protein
MQDVTTKEWSFDAAQTNVSLQAFTAAGAVTYVDVSTGNSTSVDVAVRIGFAATTLPTLTQNSLTGNAGMVFSHAGIARGGGMVKANGGAPIAIGATGEPLRLTCTVPTGGSLRVIIGYMTIG